MGRVVKLPPPLSKSHQNYTRNSKFGMKLHTCVVSENFPFSTKIPLILLMSTLYLQKNQHFLAKIVPYSKQ